MPPFVIALLTASSVLLGAAFGAVATIRAARVKGHAEETLERLRYINQQNDRSRALKLEALSAEVRVAEDLCRAIQVIRDKIRELAFHIDQGLASSEVQDKIKGTVDAAKKLWEVYSDGHVALSEEVRHHSHDAKTWATTFIAWAELYLDSCVLLDQFRPVLDNVEPKLDFEQRALLAWIAGAKIATEALAKEGSNASNYKQLSGK
jgi:hypothetical protein